MTSIPEANDCGGHVDVGLTGQRNLPLRVPGLIVSPAVTLARCCLSGENPPAPADTSDVRRFRGEDCRTPLGRGELRARLDRPSRGDGDIPVLGGNLRRDIADGRYIRRTGRVLRVIPDDVFWVQTDTSPPVVVTFRLLMSFQVLTSAPHQRSPFHRQSCRTR